MDIGVQIGACGPLSTAEERSSDCPCPSMAKQADTYVSRAVRQQRSAYKAVLMQ